MRAFSAVSSVSLTPLFYIIRLALNLIGRLICILVASSLAEQASLSPIQMFLVIIFGGVLPGALIDSWLRAGRIVDFFFSQEK